jgi:hypothetical protein
MKLTNLRTFMFVKVTWTTPVHVIQKFVKRGSQIKRGDLKNVDADLRDLVTTKRSKSLPTSFVFGESKVTTNMNQEYELLVTFLQVMVMPLSTSKSPLLHQAKLWFFETSLPAGSDYPVTLC